MDILKASETRIHEHDGPHSLPVVTRELTAPSRIEPPSGATDEQSSIGTTSAEAPSRSPSTSGLHLRQQWFPWPTTITERATSSVATTTTQTARPSATSTTQSQKRQATPHQPSSSTEPPSKRPKLTPEETKKLKNQKKNAKHTIALFDLVRCQKVFAKLLASQRNRIVEKPGYSFCDDVNEQMELLKANGDKVAYEIWEIAKHFCIRAYNTTQRVMGKPEVKEKGFFEACRVHKINLPNPADLLPDPTKPNKLCYLQYDEFYMQFHLRTKADFLKDPRWFSLQLLGIQISKTKTRTSLSEPFRPHHRVELESLDFDYTEFTNHQVRDGEEMYVVHWSECGLWNTKPSLRPKRQPKAALGPMFKWCPSWTYKYCINDLCKQARMVARVEAEAFRV